MSKQKVIGFTGKLKIDVIKSNGTIRKLMNVLRLKSLGREHKVSLKDGIEFTYSVVRGKP